MGLILHVMFLMWSKVRPNYTHRGAENDTSFEKEQSCKHMQTCLNCGKDKRRKQAEKNKKTANGGGVGGEHRLG